MDLYQSAKVEKNHHRACNAWHIDQDWTIKRWEVEYVYTPLWVAHLLFQSFEFSHFHQMAQVAFWAEVAPVLVDMDPFLCTLSLSVDSLLCHFGKAGSQPFGVHKPLPGVLLSQHSPCYDRETQHLASCLLGLPQKVSLLVVTFHLLRRAKTILWPFWPYSRQDRFRTIQAVRDVLVVPQ